jgi:hypothetical protein
MGMKTRSLLLVWCILAMIFAGSLHAADEVPGKGTEEGQGGGSSLTEINQKLTNPVSDLWSITFQQNNYLISTLPGQSDRWNSNLQFQPVMPVSLIRDWNLITRPVIPLFVSQPRPGVKPGPPAQPDVERTTGFGDMVLLEMLSPAPSLAGNWLLGIGPTFIFPTASTDYTGQGKWQAGPGAVAGYLSKKYILGAFVQNWTSFAGDSDRPATNQMNLQPIASWFLPEGWSVGYSGNILADWKADSSNVWTVPIGVSVAKVVKFGKLPVRVALGGQYMPIHPDDFGQKWNVQLVLAPVLPKLIKGSLFE